MLKLASMSLLVACVLKLEANNGDDGDTTTDCNINTNSTYGLTQLTITIMK